MRKRRPRKNRRRKIRRLIRESFELDDFVPVTKRIEVYEEYENSTPSYKSKLEYRDRSLSFGKLLESLRGLDIKKRYVDPRKRFFEVKFEDHFYGGSLETVEVYNLAKSATREEEKLWKRFLAYVENSYDIHTSKLRREQVNRSLTKEVAGKWKKVVRNGKRVRKLQCPDGYKAKDGKCVRMSKKELRNRKRAAKKRKTSSAAKKRAAQKRKKSNKKR